LEPSASAQQLDYFAGDWNLEGEFKQSPFGPGGKCVEKEHFYWLSKDSFLVLHSDWTGPFGNGATLGVLGIDPEKKFYTLDAFESNGTSEHWTQGTVQHNIWVWTGDERVGSMILKARYTITTLTPTLYTVKYETSLDGQQWTTTMEGKATKIVKTAETGG